MSDNNEHEHEEEVEIENGVEAEAEAEVNAEADADTDTENASNAEYYDVYADITTEDDLSTGWEGSETEFDNAYINPELEQVDLKHSGVFWSFMKKIKKPAIITAAVLLILCSALWIYGMATLPTDTVMKNVYIDNIRLGGMTYDEVLSAITADYMMNDPDITLSCHGSTFAFHGSDIGMAANMEDTAKRAYDYGKDGNILTNGFKNALCTIKRHVIKPAANIDRELLIGKINEFGIELYGEMAEHYVEINEADTTADVHPGHTGYKPSAPESYTEAADIVLGAIAQNRYTNIYVPLSETSPVDMTIEMFDAAVYCEEADAQYVIENNEVTITPAVNGRYIDKAEAQAYLINVFEGGEVVRIPYYVTPANVTEAQLQEKLFSSTLGTYSTNFSSSTSNRAANVSRAASLINGKVLAPGETFSFNDTVGLRTKENGFYPATEYVNGESVEGIGGGTCQVSTTLYSAVLYADLQIVHRECHMMSVGYVPLGQDATVADNSVDFKFSNSTDYPIKISAYTEGRTLYVSIIGAAWEPARKVELKHNVSSSGENTVVTSTRYVYSNGELISTDPLSSSLYRPHKSAATQTTAETATESKPVSGTVTNDDDDASDYDTDYDTDYDADYDDEE